MVTDNSKQMSVSYNLLNLPDSVTFALQDGPAAGKSSKYYYSADGEKLATGKTNRSFTDYISGIQYDSDTTGKLKLSFIQTDEGRMFPYNKDTANYYEYYLTDHLGNTRAAFDSPAGALTIEQQDDYMPFGMEISTGATASSKNEYLYNRKELQENSQLYDYGARFYDPVVGRFNIIDPMVMKYAPLSPYQYAVNNPIRYVDKVGLGPGDRVKAARSMLKTPYRQEHEWDENGNRTYLRTGSTKDALECVDCSEFVSRVLAADGVTPKIEAWTTQDLVSNLTDNDKFASSNVPQTGDIFLWRKGGHGHTGIVESVDEDGTIHTLEAYGTQSGTLRVNRKLSAFTKHQGWKGFFRPKEETEDGKLDAKPSKKKNESPKNNNENKKNGENTVSHWLNVIKEYFATHGNDL